MPSTNRPNRESHTRLKELRKICGFTQTVLAEKIGTSLATIVAIETGTLAMSEDLATRIMLVTGVEPESLRKGPKLLSIEESPTPFDEAAYKRLLPLHVTTQPGEVLSSFKGGFIDIADQKLNEQSRELEGELRAMVLFTAKRNQFSVFRYMFRRWIKELTMSFQTQKAAEAITKEHPGKLIYEEPEWARKKPVLRAKTIGKRK